MKTTIITLACCLAITLCHSQILKPGVYRYKKDQNEALITIEGDVATLKAWKTEIKAKKESDKKFADANGNYLEVISSDVVVLGNANQKDELLLHAPAGHKNSDPNITQFELDGKTYYAVPYKEKDLVGEYLYMNRGVGGEPKVLLNENGTGYFQRHSVPPTPIAWWGVDTNYKGEIQQLEYGSGISKKLIAVKYNDGKWQRMEVVVRANERKSSIMGERIYQW